jgi:hypothetical protein
MLMIRRFEEKAGQMYGMGLIGGFCHLYIGQEAVVVGMQMASAKGDQVITGYRDHGHMLAAGMDPKEVMAELTGRSGGSSKGKGGSMHMFDVPTGCLHALMPGLFIWEVQQRSDRTYRVADWGRNDPSRPLHASEAIRATDAEHQATRTTAIDWGRPGEQTLVTSPHFAARAVVGPWTGKIVVGPHGATATATGAIVAGGLRLGALASAHLAAGEIDLEISVGAALLIAEGH